MGRPAVARKKPEVISGGKAQGGVAATRMMDEGSVFALEVGVTISQIARKLGSKPENVRSKIIAAGLKPSGQRGGFPVYDILDVGALFKPPTPEAFERFMRSASHHDLPALLSRDFWNGLAARAKYERESGELWDTQTVVEGVSRIAKLVRMMLLTLPDQVHRRKPLTTQERRLIKDVCDNTLASLENAIREAFGGAANEQPEPEPVRGGDPLDDGSAEDEEAGEPTAERALDPAWDI